MCVLYRMLLMPCLVLNKLNLEKNEEIRKTNLKAGDKGTTLAKVKAPFT